MTKTTTTAISEAEKIALKAAKSDMKKYAKLKGEIAGLKDSAKTKEAKAKVIEERLIAFGNDRKDQFEKGNFDLGPGYLHIAKKTVVETTEKFDIEEFVEDFPECVKMELKTKELAEAYFNDEHREEIQKAGISLKKEDEMEVKLNKK
jgi:hypothetical protein